MPIGASSYILAAICKKIAIKLSCVQIFPLSTPKDLVQHQNS